MAPRGVDVGASEWAVKLAKGRRERLGARSGRGGVAEDVGSLWRPVGWRGGLAEVHSAGSDRVDVVGRPISVP